MAAGGAESQQELNSHVLTDASLCIDVATAAKQLAAIARSLAGLRQEIGIPS